MAEKSDAPMGMRSQLMPMPWLGLNNAFITFVCAVPLSLSDNNQAEVSVIAAPKPSMVWNVCASLTLMVPEPDDAEKPRLACCVRCWLRSEVVSHFWTASLAAEAGGADSATSAEIPSTPARAPATRERSLAVNICVKPFCCFTRTALHEPTGPAAIARGTSADLSGVTW